MKEWRGLSQYFRRLDRGKFNERTFPRKRLLIITLILRLVGIVEKIERCNFYFVNGKVEVPRKKDSFLRKKFLSP